MRLVYALSNEDVKIGDRIITQGEAWDVVHFKPPHKPSSSGSVTVKNKEGELREFYCHVLGMEWIDREDRQPESPNKFSVTDLKLFLQGEIDYNSADGNWAEAGAYGNVMKWLLDRDA